MFFYIQQPLQNRVPRVRSLLPLPSRGYKKDVARENPDVIGVFTVLYGKISANRFDRYKNDVFPLLDVLNSHTTE